MKKFSWSVALLIALSLALIGCPTGGGGGGDGPGTGPGSDPGWTNNLGEITLDLTDNFQYGKGYQGVLKTSALFAGKQVAEGDVYNLKITFTASRDLTDILYVGLVDTTAAANYWKPLTWPGDPDKPEAIDGAEDDKIILEDEEISVTITMTATASASDATIDANALVFMTDSTDGTPGTGNSGTLGKITLTFTEFIFAKGDIDDGVEAPEAVELEVKKTILLSSAGDTSIWAWEAGDVTGSLKGKLTTALSTEILGYTGGEVWLYWEYVGTTDGGIGSGWGVGTFGTATITVGGGMDGIVKLPVADIEAKATDNGQLDLNIYNDCIIVKIEVWGAVE